MRNLLINIVSVCLSLQTFAQVNITAVEYFIDTDPGFGGGTAVPITTNPTVSATINIPTASLSTGVHHLYIRSLDANGVWSMTEERPFTIYVPPTLPSVPNLNGMEYFVDNDPGEGNATPISIGTGTVESASITINTTGLSPGIHYLHVRALESNGNWGIPEARPFSVSAVTSNSRNITLVEYFFDTDPGLNNGTQISINPTVSMLNLDTLVNTTSLSLGNHDIGVRTLDEQGNWSFTETFSFNVCDGPNPNFQMLTTCVGEDIQFNDQSTDIFGGEIYRWDLDGDNVFDAITSGGSTFNYSQQGSYNVHLQIEPLSGCIGNLFQSVEVFQAPLPDFSNENICLGATTILSDQSSGLTSSSSYQWDFEGDGSIDDFSGGDVSFTPVSVGTINSTLTISNGAGCERTITKPLIVFDQPAAPVVENAIGPQFDALLLTASGGMDGDYKWYFNETDTLAIANEVNSTYETDRLSASRSFFVSLVDDNDCESPRVEVLATIDPLQAKPSVNVFNVVTTRMNGKHDFLKIENIEFYPFNEVVIYNRWGDSVIQITEYNNADRVFSGMDKNGSVLPDGTYYYVVDTGENQRSQGFFLLRN